MNINDHEYSGLTNQEVTERINNNLINQVDDNVSKSNIQIIKDNVFTFFNFLNITLFIILMIVGSHENGLFISIITINTIIGTFQELRAKKVLEKLVVLNKSKYSLIRNNDLVSLNSDEIVRDDILILVTGEQIPTDSQILDGYCEVNESLLTGESDTIIKTTNDYLFSGSFITSGKVIAKVKQVGKDNYINKVTLEAKAHRKYNSQLNNVINKILKYISIIILPIGILLLLKQMFISHLAFNDAVVATIAALVGMIPEGLVLLTTVALTLGVIRLTQKQALVQEIYSIETLARVDVLCLDKTGTLTKGELKVIKDLNYQNQDLNNIIGNIVENLEDSNVTSLALKAHYQSQEKYPVKSMIPFSSQRKYSGVCFENIGSYYLGASEFLFPEQKIFCQEDIDKYAGEGYRIITLAHSQKSAADHTLPDDLKPIAIILLQDALRENVNKTLSYFSKQQVDLKIISGDNPVTVASIARQAGLKDPKYIDASTISDEDLPQMIQEFNIFGRVSPNQKKAMVLALKAAGKTVAMTGDGVNDLLALKEADCSIAMASGSQATKDLANIVLLSNDFTVLPFALREGRRVINNITRSASMFLIKTAFSTFLALITILVGKVYPFQPIQLSLVSGLCIGIPTFFLTYEANFSPINKEFIKTVTKNSLPYAFSIVIYTFLIMNIGLLSAYSRESLSTMCIVITGWIYFIALKRLYKPMNNYRRFIIYTCQITFFICLIIFHNLLKIQPISLYATIILLILIVLTYPICNFNTNLYAYLIKHKLKIRFKD